MAVFQPAPTYADVVLYDKASRDVESLIRSAKFNPIWLNWFLELGKNVGPAGAGSVSSVSFTGGLISVATSTTTPALTVAGAAGSFVYFNSGSTWASSGLTTNAAGADLIYPGIAVPAIPAAGFVTTYAQTDQGHTLPHALCEMGISFGLVRDNVLIVRNTSGAPITAGSAVDIYGSTGQVPNVRLADATDANKHTEGLLAAAVANNGFGLMYISGLLSNIDTHLFTEGDVLYTSTTPGGLTTTPPAFTTAAFQQRVGVVTNSHATQGSIEVALAGHKTLVDLAADVTGNLAVTHLNSGTAAGATTFWCGDTTWKVPAGTYVLPTATSVVLGGVKPDGTTITNTAGAISVTYGTTVGTAAQGGVIVAGGPIGSATVTPIVTYNAAGQLTTVSSATVTPAVGSVTGLGTGVATALAVNVGSAGALITNGGALGSPSSAGTIPAFTLGGTIAGGGNQVNNVIIGTSTPLAGTFTTLTATGLADLSGAAAGQIKFPSTQNASADVHTLDDYAEGTWTPALVCGTSGTITINSVVSADYTKVGRQISFNCYVTILSVSSPLGALSVTGLPGSPAAAAPVSIWIYNTAAGLVAMAMGYVPSGAGQVNVWRFLAGVGSNDVAAYIQAGTQLMLSGVYNV